MDKQSVVHPTTLDAERERLAAEVDLYRGIVAIYKALGGGAPPPG